MLLRFSRKTFLSGYGCLYFYPDLPLCFAVNLKKTKILKNLLTG